MTGNFCATVQVAKSGDTYVLSASICKYTRRKCLSNKFSLVCRVEGTQIHNFHCVNIQLYFFNIYNKAKTEQIYSCNFRLIIMYTYFSLPFIFSLFFAFSAYAQCPLRWVGWQKECAGNAQTEAEVAASWLPPAERRQKAEDRRLKTEDVFVVRPGGRCLLRFNEVFTSVWHLTPSQTPPNLTPACSVLWRRLPKNACNEVENIFPFAIK